MSSESSEYQTIEDRNGTTRKVLATPAVRRIAKENQINLAQVKATGVQGRILKEDILNYLENPKQFSSQNVSSSSSTSSSPSTSSSTSSSPSTSSPSPSRLVSPSSNLVVDLERREPVRGITKAMIESMTLAAKIPLFGYKDEIEMVKI